MDEVYLDVWFLGGPHDGRGPISLETTQRKVAEKRITFQRVEYRLWIGMVDIPDGSPTKRTYLIHPRADALFNEGAN